MMKLSVMLRVDSAVDDDGRSRIADRILGQWEHDPGSARFARSSANFVYVFSKGNERFFLRFADSSERSAAEIGAEMALLRWVASQGMAVTTPVASNNGRDVETVETDMGVFSAVVFAALQGVQFDIEELNAAQFEVWGATLGKLHATLRLYQGPTASVRRTWRDSLEMVRCSIPADELRVQAEYEYLAAWLAALPVTATNYGLIHGDFELDNLFWQDETLAMLDFDDCSYWWYGTDVAFALRDLFADGVDLDNPSLQAFIRGYRTHAALDEKHVAQLPIWMRLANLLAYAKLLRTMDLAKDQAVPEWVPSLLSKLENWIHNYKTSLLSIPMG